jgi:hypothetical protein
MLATCDTVRDEGCEKAVSKPVNKPPKITGGRAWSPKTYREAMIVLSLFAGYATATTIGNHSGIHKRCVQRVLGKLLAAGMLSSHIVYTDAGKLQQWCLVEGSGWTRALLRKSQNLVAQYRTKRKRAAKPRRS